MTEDPGWFRPAGSLAREGCAVVVDETVPGWAHAGLRVARLGDGGAVTLADRTRERIVIPLSGDAVVDWTCGSRGGRIELQGRPDVFAGPADSASFGADTVLRIAGDGHVAIAEAVSEDRRDPATLRAADTPVEERGAGRATRFVRNFGVPGALPAERLIVCEVITPAGNWSSYPPHKHDERTETESRLEEVYYFETATTRAAPTVGAPFATFAAYSSEAGELEISSLVRTGDVALVPFGYHGPAAAPPGYDLYYLNVMAGPDREREWRITDDPAHAWVRSTW